MPANVLRSFGFIVKGPGYSARVHRVAIDSSQFATLMIGVPNADDASGVVREMVSLGVQLIELCGGFTDDEARGLEREAGDIPVGWVTYGPEKTEKLRALFASLPET
jgi:hypothetical protein